MWFVIIAKLVPQLVHQYPRLHNQLPPFQYGNFGYAHLKKNVLLWELGLWHSPTVF